jgi:hypothetical protein
MKRLLFLMTGMLLLSTVLFSQYATHDPHFLDIFKSNDFKPHRDRDHQALKTILVYSGSILLNGVGDGLIYNHHKNWGYACNTLSIGTLIASPLVIKYDKHKWYGYILDYAFLRYTLYDSGYNITNGDKYQYLLVNDRIDKMFRKAPAGMRSFDKVITLIVGISLPINDYK